MRRSLARPTPQSASELLRVLGLQQKAGAAPGLENIKEAYRRKALELHPDRARGARDKASATERFQEIQWAYQTLLGEAERQAPAPGPAAPGAPAGAPGPRTSGQRTGADFAMDWMAFLRRGPGSRPDRGRYVDNLQAFVAESVVDPDAARVLALRRRAAKQLTTLLDLLRDVTGAVKVMLVSKRSAEHDLVALQRLAVLARAEYLGVESDGSPMEEGGPRYAPLTGVTLVLTTKGQSNEGELSWGAGAKRMRDSPRHVDTTLRGAFDESAGTVSLELTDVTMRWRHTLQGFGAMHIEQALRSRALRSQVVAFLRKLPVLARVQFVAGHSCDPPAFDAFLSALAKDGETRVFNEDGALTRVQPLTAVVENLRRNKAVVTMDGKLQLDAGMDPARVLQIIATMSEKVAQARSDHRRRHAAIRGLARQLRVTTNTGKGLWGSGLLFRDVRKGPGVTWEQVETCMGRLVMAAAGRAGPADTSAPSGSHQRHAASWQESQDVDLVVGKMWGVTTSGDFIIPWDWRAS